MRRSLTLVLVFATSALVKACDCVRCVLDPLSRTTFAVFPTLEAFNEVRRRDLLEGQMPKQATPTQKATRITRDQRPGLLHFLLPRNDFAF